MYLKNRHGSHKKINLHEEKTIKWLIVAVKRMW